MKTVREVLNAPGHALTRGEQRARRAILGLCAFGLAVAGALWALTFWAHWMGL
jgi:hypothetical protein